MSDQANLIEKFHATIGQRLYSPEMFSRLQNIQSTLDQLGNRNYTTNLIQRGDDIVIDIQFLDEETYTEWIIMK